MYLQHFGLTEFPFGITPDTSFTFSAHGHQEALNTLLVALQWARASSRLPARSVPARPCFAADSLQTLGEGVATAYLPNPNLEPQTLLLALAEELRIADASGLDQYHLLRRINHALLDYARAGKRRHSASTRHRRMPLDTLEALAPRLQSRDRKRKLIQIVLFGQPELDENFPIRRCASCCSDHVPSAPGLGSARKKSRSTCSIACGAGYYRASPVHAGALAHRRATRGTPRLINVLAHKSCSPPSAKDVRSSSSAT